MEQDNNSRYYVRTARCALQFKASPIFYTSIHQSRKSEVNLLCDSTEQMSAGLKSIQAILGSSSEILEKEIMDSLWYYYFDEEKTLAWLLGSSWAMSRLSCC